MALSPVLLLGGFVLHLKTRIVWNDFLYSERKHRRKFNFFPEFSVFPNFFLSLAMQ